MIKSKRITNMALVYIEQLEDLDVEEMQQTHEDEVKLLNEIDKLATQYQIIDKSKLPELETKLNAYVTHVKEHFSNEERLMRHYKFPSYEMHKMAHDIFLDDMNHAVNQWKRDDNIDKIIYFIRKSPEWIVMHINTVDAPTSAFLHQQMQSNA
jgi:hemerythrin